MDVGLVWTETEGEILDYIHWIITGDSEREDVEPREDKLGQSHCPLVEPDEVVSVDPGLESNHLLSPG